MILAVGEVLVELRRADDDGALATPGTWQGPFCSGAPAIFASVAARMGASVGLAGAVGDDAFGHLLVGRLRHDGVDTTAVASADDRATAIAMVAYDARGERDFFFSVRGSAAEAIDDRTAASAARGAEWIHVSGSSLGFGDRLATTVEATVEASLRAGARLSLDPNLRPDAAPEARRRTADLARRASVVFPSSGELAALGLTTAELLDRGALVCMTQGAGGVELHAPDGSAPARIPAPTVAEVDATGAGDHFAAAFLACFAGGAPATRAATVACAVAADSVTALGAMEADVGQHAPVDRSSP